MLACAVEIDFWGHLGCEGRLPVVIDRWACMTTPLLLVTDQVTPRCQSLLKLTISRQRLLECIPRCRILLKITFLLGELLYLSSNSHKTRLFWLLAVSDWKSWFPQSSLTLYTVTIQFCSGRKWSIWLKERMTIKIKGKRKIGGWDVGGKDGGT